MLVLIKVWSVSGVSEGGWLGMDEEVWWVFGEVGFAFEVVDDGVFFPVEDGVVFELVEEGVVLGGFGEDDFDEVVEFVVDSAEGVDVGVVEEEFEHGVAVLFGGFDEEVFSFEAEVVVVEEWGVAHDDRGFESFEFVEDGADGDSRGSGDLGEVVACVAAEVGDDFVIGSGERHGITSTGFSDGK